MLLSPLHTAAGNHEPNSGSHQSLFHNGWRRFPLENVAGTSRVRRGLGAGGSLIRIEIVAVCVTARSR